MISNLCLRFIAWECQFVIQKWSAPFVLCWHWLSDLAVNRPWTSSFVTNELLAHCLHLIQQNKLNTNSMITLRPTSYVKPWYKVDSTQQSYNFNRYVYLIRFLFATFGQKTFAKSSISFLIQFNLNSFVPCKQDQWRWTQIQKQFFIQLVNSGTAVIGHK